MNQYITDLVNVINSRDEPTILSCDIFKHYPKYERSEDDFLEIYDYYSIHTHFFIQISNVYQIERDFSREQIENLTLLIKGEISELTSFNGGPCIVELIKSINQVTDKKLLHGIATIPAIFQIFYT